MEKDNPLARQIYEDIGVYLAYALPFYAKFYDIKHVLLLGRVTGGKGGNILLDTCKKVLADYTNGTIGEIYLVYTHFKNTVVHEPKLMKLLPIEFDEEELGAAAEANVLMNYEPNETEALDMIIPKYVTSLFYGALVEAVASENGARMQAMDSATSNAEDMISDLTLKYNRARQGSITQELTEIIAGASAISG